MDLSQVARQLRRQATLREAQDSVEGPQMRNSFLQDLPLEPWRGSYVLYVYRYTPTYIYIYIIIIVIIIIDY